MPNQFNTYGGQLAIGSHLKQTITNPGKDQTRELDIRTETVYVSQASDFGDLVGGVYEVIHNPTGLSSSTATVYELTADVTIANPLKLITTGGELIVLSLKGYTLTYTGTGSLITNQSNTSQVIVIDGGYGGRLLTPPASGGSIFGLSGVGQIFIGDTGIFSSNLGTIANAGTVSIVTSGIYGYQLSQGLTFLNVGQINLNVITAQLLSPSGGTTNSNQVLFTVDGTTPLIGSANSLIIVDAQSTHSVFDVKNTVPVTSFYITSSGFFGVASPTNNNLLRSTGQSQFTTSTLDVVDFDPFENVSPFAFLYFASPNATTTTGTANTDRVIQGTPITSLQFFTYNASTGTFTYTGLRPVVFTIHSLLSITGTTGNIVTLYIYYNGTALTLLPDTRLNGVTDPSPIAFNYQIKLNPNDTLRVAIRVDSVQSVTVKNYSFLIE